jgi:Fic family protein
MVCPSDVWFGVKGWDGSPPARSKAFFEIFPGHDTRQPQGYSAFIPAPLPPAPPINVDSRLMRLLSDADRALGRLDGVTTILPNPDLFVAMYVRQEAVFSSQIAGTQSTLEDVLAYEAGPGRDKHPQDVEEVVNYVRAMNDGLRALADLPLCLRLIRQIHAEFSGGFAGEKGRRGSSGGRKTGSAQAVVPFSSCPA